MPAVALTARDGAKPAAVVEGSNERKNPGVNVG